MRNDGLNGKLNFMETKNPAQPSPADTPSSKPVDQGGKSKIKPEDKKYRKTNNDFGNIAGKKENEEQPVNPIKKEPKPLQ